MISSLYGAVATWRRQWYARDPARRRMLTRPVISIGNLSVGGSGKTPIVEYVARQLLQHGERPAILTRGYARRRSAPGVTVVSDGVSVLADVDSAGDEPLMLARALPGVAVLVSADRYLSGRLAETRLGATVHVLDDGFQHLVLARTVDLLLLSEDDLGDRLIPSGRLREPLTAAAAADAALVTAGYATAVDRVARTLGVARGFLVARALGAPRRIGGTRESVVVPTDSRVFAVAGVARPDRFFSDVESVGWRLVGSMAFRDHHRFGRADIARIAKAAKASAAAIILTTEKDAMRFEACDLGDLPIAAVPLIIGIEPPDVFRDWLFERLQ